MKSFIRKPVLISAVALVIFVWAMAVRGQTRRSVHLNGDAFAFAGELINQGRVIPDGKGAWREHRPPADHENEFIRLHGFGDYAKWHLGIDDRYPENTKRRYKFPYGDFKNVHRCGLLAARSRAAEYRYTDIERAAAQLIEVINRQAGGSASVLPRP